MTSPSPELLAALGLTRRRFLGSLAAGAVLALGDLPALLAAPLRGRPRVVTVHHPDATTWDFKTGWYGDAVNQALVDAMLDRAVMELFGTADPEAAWRGVVPAYRRGEKVAVKLNLNNAWRCTETDNVVDALPQVVNALVRGLLVAGVAPGDIWLYDALRVFPTRFQRRLRHAGVVLWSRDGSCGTRKALFTGRKPGAILKFTRPIPSQTLTDVVVDARHLIHVPIAKRHSMAGLTLTYKNHFGSIPNPAALHDYINMRSPAFSTKYSPMVEYWANPHLGGKTRLVLGDCLYGSWPGQSDVPRPWKTFGNRSPATLVVGLDPVATDCLLRDYLFRERPVFSDPKAEAYLKVAAAAGQGVYEAMPAPGRSYQVIDHRHVELAGAGWFRVYARGRAGTGGKTPGWRFAGVPAPGRKVLVEVVDARPRSGGVLLVGRRETAVALPVGTLLVEPVLFGVALRYDGDGRARIPLDLPPGSGSVGSEYTAQAVVLDPEAAHGLAYTPGLRLRIGAAR